MLRTDYAHAPQRFVYVMPYGSNIDVARCGWDAHMMSNSREMFRYTQHGKWNLWRCGFNRTHYRFMCATEVAPPKNMQNHERFHVSLRASGASVAINSAG
ncbi:MAG: hypothetical protein K2N54_08555 [Helicobacter sp.]|nr:hypothetical protein [Helicobacter sp.]